MNTEVKTNAGQPISTQSTHTVEHEPANATPEIHTTTQQFQEVRERMTAYEKSTVLWTRAAVLVSIAAVFVSILAAIFIWALLKTTIPAEFEVQRHFPSLPAE